MGFVKALDEFVDYVVGSGRKISSAAVAVTERYARRKLKIRAKEPLVYRGMQLRCIGSKRWRMENS